MQNGVSLVLITDVSNYPYIPQHVHQGSEFFHNEHISSNYDANPCQDWRHVQLYDNVHVHVQCKYYGH